MNQQPQEQPTTSTKWAPWWVYLVIIVGANYLRRAVVADGGIPRASRRRARVFRRSVHDHHRHLPRQRPTRRFTQRSLVSIR